MTRDNKVARRMLTTEEAADYLGTTARHVRRLVSDHELSRYKVGGRNRFADVDLDAWLDARRVEGRAPRRFAGGGGPRRSASRVAGR
jgi:excisionase family DNA binding protein